jgi:hypothetical protein
MGNTLIGHTSEELASDAEKLGALLKGNQGLQIEICTEGIPTAEDLAQMVINADQQGYIISMPCFRMVNGIPTTAFVIKPKLTTAGGMTTGFAWAALIPVIVPLATIGIIAYGITQIGDISKAIIPILLIVGGIAIAGIALLRQPLTTYAGSGKPIPYMPQTVSSLPAVTKEYYKSNPPTSLTHEGIEYGIHMTFEKRMDAEEEAKDLRSSGHKTRIVPWEGGYAIYEHSMNWDDKKRRYVPQTEWAKIGERVLILAEENPEEKWAEIGRHPKGSILKINEDIATVKLDDPLVLKTYESGINTTYTEYYIKANEKNLWWKPILNKMDYLKQSAIEEIKAEKDYHDRADIAQAEGDTKSAELWRHIASEESKHWDEFMNRIHDLGESLNYIPDTAEYMAQNIQECGVKEQLGAAFQNAIQRSRG